MTAALAKRAGVPKRPVLRYHGGKWMLADRLIALFPAHRVYVEAFGGGGSVLMRKPRTYAEIYNDLDDEVVGLFRLLREPATAVELERRLRLTPFARAEFQGAYAPTDDPIERARRLVIRSFMGFGSDGCYGEYKTGFRANSNRSGTTPARDWANYWDAIPDFTARLAGVVIDNAPAIDVMKKHDGPETLHYLDPPYMHETRARTTRKKGGLVGVYKHEMSDADHENLLDFLVNGWRDPKTGAQCQLQGAVAISGYTCPLYDRWLVGWERHELPARADGAKKRVEVLWVRGRSPQGCLLRGAA